METDETVPWESLETRRPTLFLLASLSMVGYASLLGAEAFLDVAVQEDAFMALGLTLGFVGLLGFYPRLADRTPWLARIGVVGAVLGAVGFTLVFLVNVGMVAGVVPEDPPSIVVVVLLTSLAGIVLGYLVTGVATLRAGVHPKAVGVLLMAPAALFVADLAVNASVGSGSIPVWAVVLLGGGQTLTFLALGSVLRTGSASTDRAEPAPQ